MSSLKVLLVDDDKNIRQTLKVSLALQDCDVETADSVDTALSLVKQTHFDFVLTDFRMDGKSGVDLIREALLLPNPPVLVLMTAFASFENAVSAIQAGAYDYLPKPFTSQQLNHLLGKVRVLVELRRENTRLRATHGRPDYFKGMVSPAMKRLEEFISKLAPTEATVLLTGESGTGKSELGRLIHELSDRAKKPFVVLNCATLTESLLESELFGYVKGAFTGATHDHIGKLELSQGGTLFIDEIGVLSLSAQTRLLRFLQEKVIERVGGTRPIPIDTRIIAATNKDLSEAVSKGAFRDDLYYRLNVFETTLTALRYRKEDVLVLANAIFDECLIRSNVYTQAALPDAIKQVFMTYSWPGNVRELRNTIERIVLLSGNREPTIEDLPESMKRQKLDVQAFDVSNFLTLDEISRKHIEKVLAVESNQEKAAEILGITTVTLWRKRKEYGLP